MFKTYLDNGQHLLKRLKEKQPEHIQGAARQTANAMSNGGIIVQLFGAGCNREEGTGCGIILFQKCDAYKCRPVSR